LKVIQGNFGNDPKKSLGEKLSEGIDRIKESNGDDEEGLRYPFILIVDTGEELRIVSDVEMEKFNLVLDLVKLSVLTGSYE
jgi:hypothetical protein